MDSYTAQPQTVITLVANAHNRIVAVSASRDRVVIGVHEDNPGLTFDVALVPSTRRFGVGVDQLLPTATEFKDVKYPAETPFSSTFAFDGGVGSSTDIIVRCGAVAGKISVQEFID
jgi:hypothetical protein